MYIIQKRKIKIKRREMSHKQCSTRRQLVHAVDDYWMIFIVAYTKLLVTFRFCCSFILTRFDAYICALYVDGHVEIYRSDDDDDIPNNLFYLLSCASNYTLCVVYVCYVSSEKWRN